MRVLNYDFENHNGLQLIISSSPAIEFNQINQFELNMLKQNKLDCYLACDIEVIDNEYKFHYPVHNYKKLQYHMQINCLTQVDLYQFISQLIDTMQKSYTYMLTPDGCIINMDALFYDEQKKQIVLAYLPVQHKDNIVYSLLQWLLYWSNQVEISDYKHIHQLLSYFVTHDFTLERIQQFILDYLYQEHIGHTLTYANEQQQSVNRPLHTSSAGLRKNSKELRENKMEQVVQSQMNNDNFHHAVAKSSNGNEQIHLQQYEQEYDRESDLDYNRENDRDYNRENDREHNQENFQEELELEAGHESTLKSIQSLGQHPLLLRTILICCIIICAPLAAWFKLYLQHSTLANLWICIGITVITISVMLLVVSKTIFKHNNSVIATDEFIDEDTADTHPAFRYYEQDKLKIATKLEQLSKQSKNNDIAGLDVTEKEAVKAVAGKQRQLDTVKMTYEDVTVHMDNNRLDTIVLVRTHHNIEKQFTFSEEDIIVGRSIEGVHINDEFSGVSRLHIQFEYKNGLVIAKDLGSRNGSYLNDKIMTPYKNYVINEQDRIQLISKDGPVYFIKWA